MNHRELAHELRKRGLKPYEGGRRWNHSYLMRKRLEEFDQTKKNASSVENAKTPEIRHDEGIGDNAQ